MKVDITLRDLNAEEAAAILMAAKEGGAKLALFFATPGSSAMQTAPAAVAAATGSSPAPAAATPPPAAEAPSAQQELSAAKPAAAAAPPANADLEKWSRYTTTKSVVKALIEGENIKDRAQILARCQELRVAGVAPLKAVPEDQFADRVGSAVLALLGE